MTRAPRSCRASATSRPVMAEHVGAIPYAPLNSLFDPLLPRGLQHYWKATFVGDLTDEAIAAHAEHGAAGSGRSAPRCTYTRSTAPPMTSRRTPRRGGTGTPSTPP